MYATPPPAAYEHIYTRRVNDFSTVSDRQRGLGSERRALRHMRGRICRARTVSGDLGDSVGS